MTTPASDSRPLGDGGPSDQAGVRPDPQDQAQQGSSSGRPQAEQEEALRRSERAAHTSRPPDSAIDRPGAARDPSHEDDGSRGIGDTERRAGTPDAHARTDTSPGDGTR